MDLNTMFAASSVGRQDAYDKQIIKEVWANFTTDGGMSNFTKADFEAETNICEKAYEAQGSEAYSNCYNAAISANTPEHNALVSKYAEAQAKGYSKDFNSFKKKTGTLSALGDIASGILGSLLGGGKSKSSTDTTTERVYVPDDDEGLSTGAKIGIGVGALAVVGVVVFLIIRKK